MNSNGKNEYELNNFEAMRISLASPEKIIEWSYGEVEKPETINYRTLKPETGGLFCEKIFGPMKDWECHCGKYKKIRYRGTICDKCGVEVTKAKVRRERMGHIKLAAPVSHIWYFKGTPSRIALCLDVTPRALERVLYFGSYIVTEPCKDEEGRETGLQYKQILSENEYREACKTYGDKFKAGMGAETIKKLLSDIALDKESAKIREELKTASEQKRNKLVKRLEVFESLRAAGNRPEWMIMDNIPVIPPDLRPMVQLDGGRFATSDLNDLYRRVINRNNRLKKLIELAAPDIIVRNEKRMLQEAVDSLIDNGRRGKAITGPGSRPLKSLSDMLKGKQGRFRQNLLGKRVDYSGRSVIVVGPELKFYQCGLPKRMALELFKPFIMKELVEQGLAHNIKSAKRKVEKVEPEVWDVLEGVIKEHPVMLNRAPTLHRLGIQAFEPILVEGKAIKLHPLVCTAFNADFDGDQMAVHVPLSVEAQAEARFLMLSVNNILAPKDGSPITTPTQDMILGSYYLTHPGVEERNTYAEKGDGKIFTDLDEMLMAYQNGVVGIHAKVKVRMFADGDERGRLVESTVGRFIFNQGIPQDLGFVDREKDKYSLEIDFICDKQNLGPIIDKCYRKHGNTGTVIMLDYIKSIGYKYSTKAAVTVSISDMTVPEKKAQLIAKAEAAIEKYENAYAMGEITDSERYNFVIDTWQRTTKDVEKALIDSLGPLNNLNIMAKSGARGKNSQISQVGGMRGVMSNAAGKTVEVPIKSNFREGLSILEFFISSNGARKGLTDTALKTANSGYLTRKLVDVSHNVIVREYDCGTNEGIEVKAFIESKTESEIPLMLNVELSAFADSSDKKATEALIDRLKGRIAGRDVEDPKSGRLLIKNGEEISEAVAKRMVEGGVEKVSVFAEKTLEAQRRSIRGKVVSKDVLDPETGEVLAAKDTKITDQAARKLVAAGVESISVYEVKYIEKLKDRIVGRISLGDIVDPSNGEVIVEQNEEINDPAAERIVDCGIESVSIRSVLTCHSRTGICAKCYGRNLASGEPVNIGEAVGVAAAQSIGEPGTQLTMRTFHDGGVASGGDITRGLERVVELFEAREPKGKAQICEIDGVVSRIQEGSDNRSKITIRNDETGEAVDYDIPANSEVVHEGEYIAAGGNITAGPLDPHAILRINGIEDVYSYLIKEVQKVYGSQGVTINDKHIEVIISQMLLKVKIDDAGDTTLLPGSMYNKLDVEEANRLVVENGGEPCRYTQILLGIAKAALENGSFLSAASFQETTKILTDAAIKGKKDRLLGLKENVIFGKLIPAGTGVRRYKNIELDYGVNAEMIESERRRKEAEKEELDRRAREQKQHEEAEEERRDEDYKLSEHAGRLDDSEEDYDLSFESEDEDYGNDEELYDEDEGFAEDDFAEEDKEQD